LVQVINSIKEAKMDKHENTNLPLFPSTVMYGNAYVPFQQWSGKLYSPIEALIAGTIFPELNQPYHARRSIHE